MDKELNQNMIKNLNSEMLIAVKVVNGMNNIIKKRIKAVYNIFLATVFCVRHTMEALFSWLIQRIDIQRVSFVCSAKALLVYTFGRLEAACVNLAF